MDALHENGFWKDFHHPSAGYAIVFEDDERVAYAYLLDPARSIIGDVWLYNRCEAPDMTQWPDPRQLPFANPADFVKPHGQIAPIDHISEVSVVWGRSTDGKPKALILIRDTLAGIVAEGVAPGWSAMAARDGPLAQVLGDDVVADSVGL